MSGINVIVPLGGLGTRFQKEGYLTRPKPFVPVLGKPMILWVLENLSLEKEDKLVIVFNPVFMNIGRFMREVVGERYPDCIFVELPGPTRGAAETVLLGLKALDEAALKRPTLLADGDTFYSADVVSRFREVCSTHNACFCFNDMQPNPIYSYVKLDDADDIVEVKEKVKISDWANSGCYCFRSGAQLAAECEALIEINSTQASQDGVGEFYTSGVIAAMIAKKEPFRALKLDVEDIHVLGTPAQVAEFCATSHQQPRQRFVFDFEGAVIAGIKGEPIVRNVEMMQRLKKQGHYIIINSTRTRSMENKTWSFLQQHDIPCDELALGKPRGDFYIGGPNVLDAILVDLDKQCGFHPTEVGVSSRPQRPAPEKKARLHNVSTRTFIGSLMPSSHGFTCLVRIVDELRAVEPAGSGKAKFWEVTCGDASGRVVLSLTEDQKAVVATDKVLFVRNAKVRIVRNYIRVTVDKWGKLDTEVGEASVDVVGDSNISLAEYELVNTPS